MTDEEVAARLLRALQQMGQVDFTVAQQLLGGLPAAELRQVVGRLGGSVRRLDPSSMTPRYSLTPAGSEVLRRLDKRTPSERLQLTLTGGEYKSLETLKVVLSDGSGRVASSRRIMSSYRLAAIRYLLSVDPLSLTTALVEHASLEIGDALAPSCPNGCGVEQRQCARCVRGMLLSALEATEEHRWVALNICAHPPWQVVPWEVAALNTGLHAVRPLALDRISVSRTRSTVPVSAGVIDGNVSVLIAPLSSDRATDDAAFKREAMELADIVRSSTVRSDGETDVRHEQAFASLDHLREDLVRFSPRILHLIGHGSSRGLHIGADVLDNSEIVQTIAAAPPELVVLGSCFGATEWGTDVRGTSLARLLINAGVPAVVAFEGKSDGESGQIFARHLHHELATSGSVHAAVRRGRLAVQSSAPNNHQWRQVVLFEA